MKPYENYMLISDLDGTIVPHGKAISAANAEAIRAFVAGGGLFGIATGRTPEAAGGYVRGLPITAPREGLCRAQKTRPISGRASPPSA